MSRCRKTLRSALWSELFFCVNSDLRRNFTLNRNYPSVTSEFISLWRQLGSYLGVKVPGDSYSGISLLFRWCLGIIFFSHQLRSSLEISRGHLGTNSVLRPLGSPLGFGIPGDSFSGIPPCFPLVGVYPDCLFAGNYIFPRWGFPILLLSWGTLSITKLQIA